MFAAIVGQSWATASHPFNLTIGPGIDWVSSADFPSIMVEDLAAATANGSCEFRLWDPDNTVSLTERSVVRFYDNDGGRPMFLGFIDSLGYAAAAVGRYVVVSAAGIGSALDRTLVPLEARPSGESTKARFGYLWGKYAKPPLVPDLTYVSNVSSSLPADIVQNGNLGTAIAQIAAQSGSAVRFYVDANGLPHLFSATESTPGDAPYGVNVALAPGAGNIAPDDLSVARDGLLVTRVYVLGANAAGSGWYQDDAGVATYGVSEGYLDVPSADTAAKAEAAARLYLGKTAAPNVRGTFTTTTPNDGWQAGQNVTVTSPQDGLSSYTARIVKVRTSFQTGEATARRAYAIEFGTTAASLTGE